MIRKLKSFTIDRGKWLNGRIIRVSEEKLDSQLLDLDTGLMCCLGIYAKACGVPEDILYNKGEPADLYRWNTENDKIEDLFTKVPVALLIETNDDTKESSKNREKWVKKYFRDAGITVRFRGTADRAVNKAKKFLKDFKSYD